METLELNLNQDKAACLIILVDTAIDTLKYKLDILVEMRKLPPADRPEELRDNRRLDETIGDNKQLTNEAIEIIQEVTEILRELDSDDYKPKPLITKPFFSGE